MRAVKAVRAKKGQDSRTTESVVLRRDIQVKPLWGPYRMALKYKNMFSMPNSELGLA